MVRKFASLLLVFTLALAPAAQADEALLVAADQRPEAEAGPAAREDATVQALYLRSGRYTFSVDVRNRSYKWVNHARGNVWVSGDRYARLSISADGYRDAQVNVSIDPNRTNYNVRVTLEDPQVWLDVTDIQRNPLQHYSREDNFMVWGDEYRFTSKISAEGFTRFDAYDVEMRVNGLFPFAERIRVRDLGSQREIEVTVKRRRMNSFSNRMEIRVRSDASFGDAPAATEEPRPTDAHSRYRNQAFRELHRVPEA